MQKTVHLKYLYDVPKKCFVVYIIVNLTNSLEQSLSWEADNFSASQEIL